jgi:transcriptional regulator with GAF, ATPase, and Fis domain
MRLLEINKRLTTERDIKRLLEYIMDSAILLTGAERGFVLLESDKSRGLEVRVARNIDQENIRNTKFKISHSIASRVIEHGEPILTVDAMEDSRYRDQLSVHDLRLRSVICLPMRMMGRVLGAIYLDNRFQTGAFDASSLAFMESFADQAGIALGNARLVSALESSKSDLEGERRKVQALNTKLEEELKTRTQELEESHRVVIAQQQQLTDRHRYDRIIGNSQPLRKVFRIMDKMLDNTIPVLISGESGTGKELVARAIHFNGNRASRPFVALNCGAIPVNLLESELFGHVRGAFTGANQDKKGLFEAAHGGTLLLDELGELPLEMQVKLLRVLQDGKVKKVGSTTEIQVDVRIIAATNRQLESEIAAGRFREDLYYRLSVVPIHLPSLRERPDDIPVLVGHFLKKNKEVGLGSVRGITPAAMALLKRHEWPGNVRQLEMVLKNVSLFCDAEELDVSDFQSFPDIAQGSDARGAVTNLSGRSLSEIERAAIIQALHDNRGNKKKSAEMLGIDRRTLYNKLKAYNIVIEKELRVT